MAERSVTNPDGSVEFRLQSYAWRSRPVIAPVSGDAVRGVVGRDEHGKFRAGTRTVSNGETSVKIETRFDERVFDSKDRAIEAAMGQVHERLVGEAREFGERFQAKISEDNIVSIDMHVGNPSPEYPRASIVSAEIEIQTPGAKAREMLEGFGKTKRERPAAARTKTAGGKGRHVSPVKERCWRRFRRASFFKHAKPWRIKFSVTSQAQYDKRRK